MSILRECVVIDDGELAGTFRADSEVPTIPDTDVEGELATTHTRTSSRAVSEATTIPDTDLEDEAAPTHSRTSSRAESRALTNPESATKGVTRTSSLIIEPSTPTDTGVKCETATPAPNLDSAKSPRC
jgi:hypothetical protein